jgi:hypothetical protein
VTPGPENVGGVAVLEEDRPLTVTDDELCPELDLGGTFLGNSMNQFFAGFVKPLDDLQEYDIHAVYGHASPQF